MSAFHELSFFIIVLKKLYNLEFVLEKRKLKRINVVFTWKSGQNDNFLMLLVLTIFK